MSSKSEIRLLGQKIHLKTSGDPDRAKAVLALVNERLRLAEKRVKEGVPHHVALLALLDLAEEYLAAKDRVADHQRAFQDKARELQGLFEIGNSNGA